MSIFDIIGGGNNNVMAQAMQAMKNGESPEAFLKNLAANNPQLQGLDFSNLQNTALQLCAKKGVNPNSAIGNIMSLFK